MVVLGHGSLSLEHLDGDSGLVIGGRREDLRLLRGNDGVPRDDLGHDSSDSLDSHGERVHVEQNDVSSVLLSRDDSSLNGGSVGNGLIGVDSTRGLLSVEELLDELLNLGDSSGSSDENDLVNVLLLEVSVLENLKRARVRE